MFVILALSKVVSVACFSLALCYTFPVFCFCFDVVVVVVESLLTLWQMTMQVSLSASLLSGCCSLLMGLVSWQDTSGKLWCI